MKVFQEIKSCLSACIAFGFALIFLQFGDEVEFNGVRFDAVFRRVIFLRQLAQPAYLRKRLIRRMTRALLRPRLR